MEFTRNPWTVEGALDNVTWSYNQTTMAASINVMSLSLSYYWRKEFAK
jgi:hypothetical protein